MTISRASQWQAASIGGMSQPEPRRTASGRDLITSADKVYFAEHGETKGDLAEHYLRVAEPLLRVMGGRPVLLERYPDGAGGPSFFQKRVPKNAPD
jgi:DNA primase